MVNPKKNVDWHAIETISTPSQTRAYIDSCKEWLIALPSDDEDEDGDINTQDPPQATVSCTHTNNGILREQIYMCNTIECFLCKRSVDVANGRIIIANPFTRAQCILCCQQCCT
jgi:hypothetical protein